MAAQRDPESMEDVHTEGGQNWELLGSLELECTDTASKPEKPRKAQFFSAVSQNKKASSRRETFSYKRASAISLMATYTSS